MLNTPKILKNLVIQNPIFFIICLCWWVLGGFLILIAEKGTWELWVNAHYTPFFNTFFSYYTHIGDGLFFAVLNVFLGGYVYFKNKKNAIRFIIWAFLSFILTGLLAQFIKNFIYPDVLRPSVALAHHFLQSIAGLEWQEYNSFPSGHSTSAFSMALVLLVAFCGKKGNPKTNDLKVNDTKTNIASTMSIFSIFLNILFAFVAILGAFSRMYLFQHFLVDIYAGSLIGLFGTIYLYVLIFREKKQV